MGLISGVLDLLFPPKCVLCRRVLPWGSRGFCQECAEKSRDSRSQIRGTFCGRCVVSLTYEGHVREAIHRLKFGDQPGAAEPLGALMGENIRRELAGTYDILSWIPVSARRLHQRGYDQGELLARQAAKTLGIEACKTLEKRKDNPQQSTIRDNQERKKNVKDVYQVLDPELIRGKAILLIDDVITTGATMEEAARTLLRAGASSVVGAAVARPPEIHTKEEQL